MDGLIINGQLYSGHGLLESSTDTGVNKSKLISLLDSGTSLSTLPQYYVDLIYKNVPGSQPVDDSPGFYVLPCETKLNVSMVFSGIEYPMNPLDITRLATSDDNSTVLCINSLTYSDPSDDRQDFILGDAFLRNVYSLFDFGNYTTVTDDGPFMQILSLTDKDKAWADFDSLNQIRINQWTAVMINGNSSALDNPVGGGAVATGKVATESPVASSSGSPDFDGLIRNSYIIMGLLVGVIVLLLVVAIGMFVKRGGGGGKGYKAVKNPAAGFPAHEKYSYETPYDS